VILNFMLSIALQATNFAVRKYDSDFSVGALAWLRYGKLQQVNFFSTGGIDDE